MDHHMTCSTNYGLLSSVLTYMVFPLTPVHYCEGKCHWCSSASLNTSDLKLAEWLSENSSRLYNTTCQTNTTTTSILSMMICTLIDMSLCCQSASSEDNVLNGNQPCHC